MGSDFRRIGRSRLRRHPVKRRRSQPRQEERPPCHTTTPRPRSPPDIHEFFAKDPTAADRAFFRPRNLLRPARIPAGRRARHHARWWARRSRSTRNMPAGLIPAAFADENVLVGKDGLTLLNDRPVNAEDAAAPARRRDHPDRAPLHPQQRHPAGRGGPGHLDSHRRRHGRQSDDLLDRRSPVEVRGGHHGPCHRVRGQRASLLQPAGKGNQWTYGAVACSHWTGVRLKDVLAAGGVQSGVVYPRACGRRRPPVGQAGQAPHLPRGADRQGDDRQRAHRLRPERRPAPSHERGAAPARGSGMAGLVLAEVAPAHLSPGHRPRRPQDDRHRLPRAELQGGAGRED